MYRCICDASAYPSLNKEGILRHVVIINTHSSWRIHDLDLFVPSLTGSPSLSKEMIRTHRVSHTRMISYNRSLSNESVISDIDEEEDEDLIIHDLSLKNDVSPTKYYDFLAEIDRQVNNSAFSWYSSLA